MRQYNISEKVWISEKQKLLSEGMEFFEYEYTFPQSENNAKRIYNLSPWTLFAGKNSKDIVF